MESFQHQSVFCMLCCYFCFPFGGGGFALPVSMYVFVFLCCWGFFFTLIMSMSILCCWGIYFYTVRSLCSNTTSVSWKHLSHPLDCFHNGSIVSFALGQGIDSERERERLCVIEFLRRCWVVITWYHITVGWRASQGERRLASVRTFECVCTALRLSQRGQWRYDKSVQNYYYMFTPMELKPIYTGLLGYIYIGLQQL